MMRRGGVESQMLRFVGNLTVLPWLQGTVEDDLAVARLGEQAESDRGGGIAELRHGGLLETRGVQGTCEASGRGQAESAPPTLNSAEAPSMSQLPRYLGIYHFSIA